MKDSPGKSKPTLASLLKDQKVIKGEELIKKLKSESLEVARQKAALDEAIEFEQRNRRVRKG